MQDSKPTMLCVVVPPTNQLLVNAELLAQAPNLDVHYIAYDDPPAVRQARRHGALTPELAAQCPALTEQDEEALARADVVIARDLPLNLETRAPQLRWVQAVGAGIEQLDPPGLASLGITLTNASGVAAAPIAEFVIARLLSIWKNLPALDQLQRDSAPQPLSKSNRAGRVQCDRPGCLRPDRDSPRSHHSQSRRQNNADQYTPQTAH